MKLRGCWIEITLQENKLYYDLHKFLQGEVIYMKFKVKRHWWIWALGLLWNIFAVRFFIIGIYPIFWGTVFLDIYFILTEVHAGYDITHRQLTVKRIILPNISFPCNSIIAIEKAKLLDIQSGSFKMSFSLGAYKIIYFDKKRPRKLPSVLVTAKDRAEFLLELAPYVNPTVKFDIRLLLKDNNVNGTVHNLYRIY